ncbi:DNA (cytosine-5)-methyltransferase 1 [Spiroplasma gladiatoris]|uniref:DNA (cytosine-5-)-methyltransferase n=1 Tax=Spiroplasma gladiatoris TaxID=2143 RepID=A0A4P7AGT3_9MOLU|nr:DNA (cytosine-5-)-methyltransferase [Spiroplasma gladiatoris]QBQ07615.1 DNA (cytosine-5)-methyltransferase 1 [Spiroplasma gladiatoris]
MKQFKILDLFSGAGGFSYGMEMNENFKTVLAVDINKNAIETFKKNFPSSEVILGDLTIEEVKEEIVNICIEKKVNMIIGGPPCQGFSLKGKKLGLNDSRNFLFLEFFHIVEKLKPEIIVIENVKNMSTASDGFFIKQIEKMFSDIGYNINHGILNSYNFGVPQIRERTIIIGCLSKNIKLPKDYITKKNTVRNAISDLNYLKSGEGSFEEVYKKEPDCEFQKQMRKDSKLLYNHQSSNHSKLSLHKLSLIPPEKGKEYLPNDLIGKQKFSTTWTRLEWDKPSPTIDTRFDTPSNGKNSHPILNRAITPREAARIQSFPDNFIFYGNKTEVCKQIGNAVPPLLSKAIADSIIKQIDFVKVRGSGFEIYRADSFNLMKDMLKKHKKFNHIFTDPPYNISQCNNFSTLKIPRKGLDFGMWDKDFNLYGWIKDASLLLDKNGSIIIFCSYRYISFIIKELEKNEIDVKDVIKWIKKNPMPRNRDRRYVQDTEFAIWGVKKGSKWVFNRNESSPYLRAEIRTNLVSGKEKTKHPTQKSLSLLKEIIEIHTNKNDVIFDPFMGSGTTGVAALSLSRKFVGIELETEYFDIARKRIENI